MKPVFFFIFLLSFPSAVSAQHTEKIDTDRPDQTESPYTIPKNYFQAEIGMNAEAYRYGIRQVVHPTSLLKYGLSNRMDLRLGVTFLTKMEQLMLEAKKTTQLQPVEIGTKIRLFEEKGLRPKTSLILQTGLPFIANKQFFTDPVNYTMRLTLQNSITENIGLGYNIGVETGESTSFFYTFSPGISIGKKWYAYIESFGDFSASHHEENIDGGLAFYLSNNTKLDASAGFGLGKSALKYYIALGFSFRLPLTAH